jgi:ABC-type multidrug transport system ATPase subunit
MTPILEVNNLVKKYGDFEAVRGISFSVEPGEVFGLLGPNGAGKTTTISMITGLFPPTSGSVTIDGHDILKEPQIVKQMNGLVPQDLALWGYYKIINQSAGVGDILPQVGILLGMALVFFLIATWRLKWAPK